MTNFRERVVRTSTGHAEAGANYFNQHAQWMKHAGFAMHNTVVDKAFTHRPGRSGTAQQVPDADLFVPIGTGEGADAIARANAIRPYLLAHFNDGTYAHKVADATSAALITITADSTDQTTLSAQLEEYRAAYNAHAARTASHNRMLFQPTIATTAADLASNIIVLNALLLQIESHCYSAAQELEIDPI